MEQFHTVVMTRPVLCVSRLILCWQAPWIIRLDLWVTVDNLASTQLALTVEPLYDLTKRGISSRGDTKDEFFNTLSQHFLPAAILVPARLYFTLYYVLSSLLLLTKSVYLKSDLY